jgi:hypothetical protein
VPQKKGIPGSKTIVLLGRPGVVWVTLAAGDDPPVKAVLLVVIKGCWPAPREPLNVTTKGVPGSGPLETTTPPAPIVARLVKALWAVALLELYGIVVTAPLNASGIDPPVGVPVTVIVWTSAALFPLVLIVPPLSLHSHTSWRLATMQENVNGELTLFAAKLK